MNDLDLFLQLSGYDIPVFTTSQMQAVLGMDSGGAAVKMNRLVNKGVLIRVIRGRYALPTTDPLCISTSIYPPSYISLWASFRHHGATTQSPRIIDIMNTTRSGTLTLDHRDGVFELRFIKTKADMIFGYGKERIGGKTCFMADIEKAIVDGLLYLEYIPIEEIFEAVNGVDQKRLIEYTNQVGKQSIKKRMGYILDRCGYDIETRVLGPISSTYVPLDPSGERRGTYDPKWRILVNRVGL